MDELFGVVFELLASLFDPKRLRPGGAVAKSSPKTLADRLRALSQQLAPPQPAAKPAAAPAAPAASATPAAAAGSAAAAAPATAAPRGVAGRPASAEGGLVAALFASPPSLVAAFIVSEVLAKPVALREP